MIDAKELRIGNWVQEPDCEPHQLKITEFDEGNYWFERLLPIPLTEEWLKKLGFYSKYKSVHMRWNMGSLDIHQKADVDDDGNSIPQEQVFYFDYQWEIKYVHQLQNLYFCLCGDELQITSITQAPK